MSQKRQNEKIGPRVFTQIFPRLFVRRFPCENTIFDTPQVSNTSRKRTCVNRFCPPFVCDIPGTKTSFSKFGQMAKQPNVEDGVGRCVSGWCGKVAAELWKMTVSREECRNFNRSPQDMGEVESSMMRNGRRKEEGEGGGQRGGHQHHRINPFRAPTGR